MCIDYRNIVQVYSTNSEEDANNYMDCGWVLLLARPYQEPYGESWTVYSLGWPTEKGDIIRPKR